MKRIMVLLSVVIGMGVLFLVQAPMALAQEDPPVSGDERATAFPGNVAPGDCQVGGQPIPESKLTVSGGAAGEFFLDILAVDAGYTVQSIFVKGADAYNLYQPGQSGLGSDPPYQDLHAPLAPNGQPQAISHWFACGIVPDTTPPSITVPGDITVDATGPATPVFFDVSATDPGGGAVSITCEPPSGSPFQVGTTTVTCTATDTSGNTSSASFTVTVVDRTAPEITAQNITVEATSPDGAKVELGDSCTASDNVDPNPTISYSSPSESTFPIGSSFVTCTATDSSGNSSTANFTVTVVDTTAPIIAAPNSITVEATGPDGAVVKYDPCVASDIADPSPTISYSSPSESTFPIGTTHVVCTATDSSGNTSTATFTVTVQYNFLGFLSPIPQSSFKAGSTIPVKFALANAAGTKIPDLDAQALASQCKVKVSFNGGAKNCATYNATTDTFQYNLKISKSLRAGLYTITVEVSAPDDSVVNTETVQVNIRR
jgi:hypothetical protein